MKKAYSYLLAVVLLLGLSPTLTAQPIIKPPTDVELRARKLPSATQAVVVAYRNSGAHAFAIFECRGPTQICYLFKSDKINDFVGLYSKNTKGEVERMSQKEMLNFFITRFKGIANDLSYQKWRPDVIVEPVGRLEPVSGDDAKWIVLLSIDFLGYASAMEEVLAKAEK